MLVSRGVMDGVLRQVAMSVDGLDFSDTHAPKLEQMLSVVNQRV